MQTTLKTELTIKGIGLHSGCDSTLIVRPALADSGIVFKRVDVADSPLIPATYNKVVDTRNCTCLGQNGVLVSTIEHLMAALSLSGIDNALIECNNQELPILDGSGKVFFEILQKAPQKVQDKPRKYLKVIKPVKFTDDKGNFIELAPNGGKNMHVKFDIEFPSRIVGHQTFEGEITPEIFASCIAPSRTFCEKYQIEYLQSLGLIKGGSLENAVVLDGESILNPEGFRVKNECVNHKVLDLLGDMFTSGYHILADITAFKSGHFHNNEVLKLLFADKANYEIVDKE